MPHDPVVGDVRQRLDEKVAARPGLAREREPLRTLVGGQGELGSRPVVDLALDDPQLAAAAGALGAAVREPHVLAEEGVEDRLVGAAERFGPEGLETDGVSGHAQTSQCACSSTGPRKPQPQKSISLFSSRSRFGIASNSSSRPIRQTSLAK
jgi:hypothetical protein